VRRLPDLHQSCSSLSPKHTDCPAPRQYRAGLPRGDIDMPNFSSAFKSRFGGRVPMAKSKKILWNMWVQSRERDWNCFCPVSWNRTTFQTISTQTLLRALVLSTPLPKIGVPFADLGSGCG
jgi:hypothetical protein